MYNKKIGPYAAAHYLYDMHVSAHVTVTCPKELWKALELKYNAYK